MSGQNMAMNGGNMAMGCKNMMGGGSMIFGVANRGALQYMGGSGNVNYGGGNMMGANMMGANMMGMMYPFMPMHPMAFGNGQQMIPMANMAPMTKMDMLNTTNEDGKKND